MPSYKMISSDSHVIEPPDLWTSRVNPNILERAPRVVHDDDADYWYVDGIKSMSFHAGSQAGDRFDDPQALKLTDRWENVRPGGYIPDEFIKDSEIDGVEASILYPSEGLVLFDIPDGRLLDVLFSIYNDWSSEFCSAYPSHLKGIAMINLDDVKVGVEELRRVNQMGMVGAMISVFPDRSKGYQNPIYDPFWAAAQDLDMPLSLHVATNRAIPDAPFGFLDQSPAEFACLDYYVRVSLGNMVFGGVFERFPDLKVLSVEHELAWAPSFIERMDLVYSQRPRGQQLPRFKNDMMPSDFFRKNIFLSFQEDMFGMMFRDVIGVDNLMWGSDYPHPESTFPKSQQIVDAVFEGVPDDQRRKILRDNAARIYHI